MKNSITTETLFKNGGIGMFEVPVYQRLFAWTDDQFDQLLLDLKEAKAKNLDEYYLGVITVVEDFDGSVVKRRLLVDGQQRLTVLTILAGVLGWFDARSLRTADAVCCSDRCMDVSKVLTYSARVPDKKALEKIWKHGRNWYDQSVEELQCKMADIPSENMRNFILHIIRHKNEWGDWCDEKSISCYAQRSIRLLMSVLPKEYSESVSGSDGLVLQNEYFEKLNAAGRQLEPHEILKVRICPPEKMREWNRVMDFTRPFDVSAYGDGDSKNEELSFVDILTQKKLVKPIDGDAEYFNDNCKWQSCIVDFPMLLQHVLAIVRVKENFKIELPNTSYKLLEWFGNNQFNDSMRDAFLKELVSYRRFLDEWIIHRAVDGSDNSQEDADDGFEYWGMQDKTTRSKIDSKEYYISKSIKQLQLFFFALGGSNQRWLCEAYLADWRSVTDHEESCKKFYEWLRGKFLEPLQEVKKKIIYKNEREYEWPDNVCTYGNEPRRELACIDYLLWEILEDPLLKESDLAKRVYEGDANDSRDDIAELRKMIKNCVGNYVPRRYRSIEHFHPQTDIRSANAELWAVTVNGIVNRDMFCNLALISAGRNSEFGNAPVREKVSRLQSLMDTRKVLESIKLGLMALECEATDTKWTPDVARRHGNMIAEVVYRQINFKRKGSLS